MNEPTHLDLFSGIGGFAIAARWAGFRTIAFCEIDGWCRKVLAKNFGAEDVADTSGKSVTAGDNGREERESNTGIALRNFDSSGSPRLFTNIFDLDGTKFYGVSLITGGFPCQPFSVAGKRGGAADDRAIWPQMFRVISEARPAFCLAENVPGIIPMELDNVLSDLDGIGYATRSFVIPACAVDARHRRDRVWIIGRNMGHTEREGSQGFRSEYGLCESGSEIKTWRASCDVSDSRSGGQPGQGQPIDAINPEAAGNGQATESVDGSQSCIWEPEPDVGRVAHGIPDRVHRLKGLGNAIVPQVAYEILREIRKLI